MWGSHCGSVPWGKKIKKNYCDFTKKKEASPRFSSLFVGASWVCPGGCCGAEQHLHKCLLGLGHSCWRSLQLLCCVPAALWSCLFWCFFLHCVSMMKSKLSPCGGTGTCFSLGAALVLKPLGDFPLPGLLRAYMGCSDQKV